jgi:hypothetical protein
MLWHRLSISVKYYTICYRELNPKRMVVGESHAGYRAYSVVYPPGNVNENRTDGTKRNADCEIQLQSNYLAPDSRRVNDRKVVSPRSKGTDVTSFSIKERDASSIINSVFSSKVRYSPKIKNGKFRPSFVGYSIRFRVRFKRVPHLARMGTLK